MKTLRAHGLSALLFIALAGCGGGSDDTGAAATRLGGTAVDGPVSGATVMAFAVGAGGQVGGQLGGSVTTAADGSYTLALPGDYSGSVVVTVSGGQYCAGSTTAQVASGACAQGTLSNLTTPMATVAQVAAGTDAANAHVTLISTAAMPSTATVSASGVVTGTVVKNDFDTLFGTLTGGKSPTSSPTELGALLDQAQNTITFKGAVKDGQTTFAFNSFGLKARFTEATQTVTYNTTTTKTYTGVKLWDMVNDLGLVTTAATNSKNQQLEYYMLATASDGYQALFALGELDPFFGNKQSQLVYEETVAGVSQPLDASDGPFRITSPGDDRGGRYVSMATGLEVAAAPATAAATKPGCGDDKIFDDCVSPSFVVNGEIKAAGQSVTFDATALQALANGAPVTLADGSDSYTGVLLWTLLNSAGVGINSTYSSRKNAINTMYAMVTGSDGYRAMVALGEINPSFGNKQVLVAYQKNGADLPASEGAVRLVVPGDVKGGRKISNVIEIKVFGAGTL